LLGNSAQLWNQFIACAVTIGYTAIVTWIICFVVDKVMGLRVSQEDEVMGLDLTQHHERAYTIFE
jgi:Amt family ammonium transporter